MMDILIFFQYLVLFLLTTALVTGLCYILSDGDLTLMFYSRFGKPVEALAGEVVWITGASSGIGESLAYRLAKAGCKLVLSARREDQLLEVKKTCLKQQGVASDDDILVLPMDVLDTANHAAHFQQVLDHFGQLDVLVNNAGRSQRSKWCDISVDVDRQIFELNVFSVVSLTRIVLPYFNARNKGLVAVTSSTAGKMGSPFSGSYTGSKHALHGYFETLRLEDGLNYNVRVSMLCLGPVMTNALQEAFTGTQGEKFGESWSSSDNRLSSERAAQLYAVTLANRLDEVYISPTSVLIFMILFTYFPSTMRSSFRLLRGHGSKIAAKLRDNKTVDKYN